MMLEFVGRYIFTPSPGPFWWHAMIRKIREERRGRTMNENRCA